MSKFMCKYHSNKIKQMPSDISFLDDVNRITIECLKGIGLKITIYHLSLRFDNSFFNFSLELVIN